MKTFLFFLGLILVVGGAGRALFQLIFLILGLAGQASTGLTKAVNNEEIHDEIDTNHQNIKDFNKERIKSILILTIAGIIGAIMMYISERMR